MKKILATVLALTMIVGMSITAFAETQNFDTVEDAKQTIDVNATYKTQPTTEDTTTVYSVNISWDAISFEYTAASAVYGWNPTTLAYDKSVDENEGAWAGDTATISLENRSNADVTVTPSWVAEEGVNVEPVISAAVTLDSAVGAGEGGVNAATTGTITVSKPTSGSIAAAGKLGTITLTITAA